MLLGIQCIVLCTIFSLVILPAQYRNPLTQFVSYPTAIRKRVEELPQYKEFIQQVGKRNWVRKIVGTISIVIIFAGIAYMSGQRSFMETFYYVFILFLSVNVYDLIIFDLLIFCHSKKLMIPGTEDMIKEYRSPWHHVIGAGKGLIIGTIAALLSATLVSLLQKGV